MVAVRVGLVVLLASLALVPALSAQVPDRPVPKPDAGPVAAVVDNVGGQVLVPALASIYKALGQNITREDVRIHVDLNFTKGDVNLAGLVIGSGRAEIQAALHARVELRVISSDRIRQLLASGGYNATMANLTFLEGLYIPAEVFRASLVAEALAAFQHAEEQALSDYLAKAAPEMQVISLRVEWSHVLPTEALTDTSLTEPPITADLSMVAQYIRVESIGSLLHAYIAKQADPTATAHDAYVDRLKRANGAPLISRDFFAAAAYTQLLNLSMEPGWSLDMSLHVPRGYAFTYFAGDVKRGSPQDATLHVDGLSQDHAAQSVFLASITQPKAVALALFVSLWVVGLALAAPLRLAYLRWGLPRLGRPRQPGPPKGSVEADPAGPTGRHGAVPNLVQSSRP